MAETASSLPNNHAQANRILILFGMSMCWLKGFMSGPPCHFGQKMRCKWKSSCEGSEISLKQNYLSERCSLSLYPQFLFFFFFFSVQNSGKASGTLAAALDREDPSPVARGRGWIKGAWAHEDQTAPRQPRTTHLWVAFTKGKVNFYLNTLIQN